MAITAVSAGSLGAKNTSLPSTTCTAAGGSAANEAAAAAAASKRLSNTTASLSIVYGSIAFYLGKKADELQTHEWTLFLRGPNRLDDHLNCLVISKVVFQLHPSFAQPTRELTEPPYEVTERGWGEFEAQIRIHWKDPSEQTTIVNHTIKLYPQGAPQASGSANNALVQQSTEKPVVAETYDEVVFTNPTESFFRSLTEITAVPPSAATEETASFAISANAGNKANKGGDKPSRSAATSTTAKTPMSSSWRDHLTTVYSDQEDFLALIAAQKFLQDELAGIKQRFQMVNDEITAVDQKLLLAQQQKQREAAAAAVRGSGTSATGSGERKRAKKSRSTSQTKKGRTNTGSKGASGSAATGTAKRGTGTGAGGSRAGSAAKAVGKAAASKAAAAAASTATAANKKGNLASGANSSQAPSSTKK